MDQQSGRSRGFGFVTFETLEASAKAVEKEGSEIDGRPIRVNYSQPRAAAPAAEKRAKSFGDQLSAPSSTLYVGGLSYSLTEDQIYETFGDHGDVQSVRLPTDRETGAPKGYGYVQFADESSAKAALEALNGQELAGRPIRIDYAGPKPDNGGAGGFGGGRGGGRGGFGGRGGGRGGFGGDRGGRGGGRGGFGGDRGRGGRGGGRGRGAPRG